MMMLSFRFPRRLRRSVAMLLLLLGVVALGRLAVGLLPAQEVSASATLKKAPGKTESQRQDFLTALGWVVDPEPCEVVEVVIPKEFDTVYTRYNALQEEQGLGLTRYRGKRCKRYTYIVQNHPAGEGDVRLNLLVYSGKIVGGDVCSLGLDGFMHGLPFPEEAAASTALPASGGPVSSAA